MAAARGLVDGILGHLSLRVDDERLLIRCRSDTDTGVAFTRPSDIRLITFDGGAGADGELDGYRVPNELPIHVETMLADSRHRAVAHLHPPAVVAADLAGIAIRPIYGAYDIPGAWLAREGVPVYERAVLIRNSALGKEMVAAMRGRPVVICRGHGITSAAATVPQAVLQAISLDALARMSLRVRAPAAPCGISTIPTGTTCPTWDRRSPPRQPGGTRWRAWALNRADRQSPWPPWQVRRPPRSTARRRAGSAGPRR